MVAACSSLVTDCAIASRSGYQTSTSFSARRESASESATARSARLVR